MEQWNTIVLYQLILGGCQMVANREETYRDEKAIYCCSGAGEQAK
jgi:hypothetical protein